MLRSILAVFVIAVLGAAAAGAYWKLVEEPGRQVSAARGPPGGGGPVAVEVVPVVIAPAETTVTAVGTLSSNESIVLKPEVDGRITDINFEEGQPVRRGTVLVELDDDVEKAQLADVEANLELAKANFERAKELRRTNAGTQRALDEAQAAMRQGDATVALAKARFAKRWLKAPFDATAGLRTRSLGDYLNAGEEIVNLEQIDPLKVDFRIPELFLSSLHEGQRISFTVDAFPGESFAGEVFAINPLVDEAGRAVVIRARIPNAGQRLRPGLFARVTLTLAERAEAMWVPEDAILPEGGQQFVFKMVDGADGKPPTVRRTVVTLGKRLPGRVQVEGLERGDRVVGAGVMKVRDQAAIRPIAVPPVPGGVPANPVAANPAPAG